MIETIAIAGIVLGLTQAVKKANVINEKYLPFIAIILGVAISGIVTVGGSEFVLQGMIYGLSAVGLYEASVDKITS